MVPLLVEACDRLAELLGALSLATDRARGQAPESALGSTVLATRLAQRMGLAPEELADTYFAALTRTLGCTSMAMDVAPLSLGDDLSLSHAIHMSDVADPGSVRRGLEEHFAVDAEPGRRAAAINGVLARREEFAAMGLPIQQQTVALSRRLPISEKVSILLTDLDARWDGKHPGKPGGEDIPVGVRLIEFSTVVELYRRAGGVQAALEVASDRAGGQFDPEVCGVFRRDASELLEGFEEASLWNAFLDAEPEPHVLIEESNRPLVAEIGADFADNKSGWFVGHSRRGAAVAVAAARELDWPEEDRTTVTLAALMRDLGRCAVPNGVWDKEGALTDRELTLARSHSLQTEEILTAAPSLLTVAQLAGSVHERADGSGYHRGAKEIDARAAIIAAADVYVALVSDRPWRGAYAESEAIEILEREVADGRLSAEPVAAVLEVCGHGHAAKTSRYPDGLTQREVEVLELLARGLLTKEIAAHLGIAYKTVDNHVQNLYRKIGANTRTAAAMYAMEHGIYSA